VWREPKGLNGILNIRGLRMQENHLPLKKKKLSLILENKPPDITIVEKSVAILPFKNYSKDEENTYFLNGLMEEVLNNLQKIKDLRVISRTSVEQYRDQTKSIPKIASELGVSYIVEGSGQ